MLSISKIPNSVFSDRPLLPSTFLILIMKLYHIDNIKLNKFYIATRTSS